MAYRSEAQNVTLVIEGLRTRIDALVEKYQDALTSAKVVREKVVGAAEAAAKTAATETLKQIEEKAAAFNPFSLDDK